MSVHRSTAPPR